MNEIDSAARVWEILSQDYDSAFTIIGRRIHLEPTRRSPGIGRKRRSELGYQCCLPPSFRAVPRSFDIIVGVLNNKPSEAQTVDAAPAALIEEGTSLARMNDQLGSILNTAGTTRQALAARTQHGKRRGYGGYGNRKPYGRPSNSVPQCFYCT